VSAFARFADERTGGLYDVIDGATGNDGSIRPESRSWRSACPLLPGPDQQKASSRCAAIRLLTSYGLRSPCRPGDPNYQPHYTATRGTATAPAIIKDGLALATRHYALARIPRARRMRLWRCSVSAPCAITFADAGLGTVSEIFEAEPPHLPGGAPSQAWSVACVIEAWWRLQRARAASKP